MTFPATLRINREYRNCEPTDARKSGLILAGVQPPLGLLSSLPFSDAVPEVLTIGGATANTVTIAVQ